MFPWRSARLTLGRTAGVVIPYKGDHLALPEPNIAPEKLGHPKKKFIFQPSIFRGYVKLKGCKRRFARCCFFPYVLLSRELLQFDLHILAPENQWLEVEIPFEDGLCSRVSC